MKRCNRWLLMLLTVVGMLLCGGISAQAADLPKTPAAWFDAEYYATNNPDVAAVYGTADNLKRYGGLDQAMWAHYTAYGQNEGRMPAASADWFDAEYYASCNPDVVAVYGDTADRLLQHYREYGRKEGRLPNAGYVHTLAQGNTMGNRAIAGLPYKIVVERIANRVKVYGVGEDGCYSVLVKEMLCSTGKEGHSTPTGEFNIYEHTANGGFVLMVDGTFGKFGMRFRQGGYMFHSVCYGSMSDEAPLQEEIDALGSSVSRGCVRLSMEDAEWLYHVIPDGTPVVICD